MTMGNNHVVQVSVQVNDRATDPLRRIANQTNAMANNFRRIGTFVGAFSTTMGRLSTVLDKAANSMFKFNMYTSNLQRNIRNVGLITAGATAALGVQSTNKSINFEYKMRQMQTRMETGPNVRKQIEDYILNDLSRSTMYKPTEIADIGVLLGQAGVNNTPDMKSLLKTTTYFSEAVDADVNDAGEMIIAASKGFDISMSKSSEITDKLTVALNKSLLRVEEMPHAIGELAGRAKMFGQSLDSSLVALMMGRDQGMSAAQTSQDFLHGLRQLSLIGTNDILFPKRKEYYERLGVDTSFFDTDKKQLKEFPEIIASLEKTMANKGLMANKEDFYAAVKANGGHVPDDVINKMASMPLISRVFGAAGQAPILMGLQSRYEEVNKETGQKTGEVFYGSDALKRMQKDLEDAQGAVERVHTEIADTAKFHLGILAGAWEAAQIKITDDALPVIKVATTELTNYINGVNKPGALDRFNQSIKDSAKNMRESNPLLADLVESLGQLAVNAIKVGDTLGPTLKQIGGSAKDNLMDADWGNSLWTLPYHAVKNGFNFIGDVASGNKEADKAISELPPELQDSATLTRKLVQGGVILVAAGAIMKIIEMAFRAASLTTKGVGTLGKLLGEMIFGKGGKNGVANALKNMTVTANIVNVYGRAITGGGVPTGLPPRPGGALPPSIGFGAAAVAVTIPAVASYFIAKNLQEQNAKDKAAKKAVLQEQGITDKNITTNSMNPASGNFQPLPKGKTISEILLGKGDPLKPGDMLTAEDANNITAYLTANSGETSSAIRKGFADASKSLENVKIENKMNFSPVINISGNIKEKIPDLNIGLDGNGNGLYDFIEKKSTLESKRVNK